MKQSSLRPLPFLLISSVLLICGGCAAASAATSPRSDVDLDHGWKFLRSDANGAEQPQFDDGAWQTVDLPHTWNAKDGEDGGNNYYRGPGWYRRHLDLSSVAPNTAGKSFFLKFDAAATVADVYVNGKAAGTHKGNFAAFCFDITPLLHTTGDNVIAVRVNNAHREDVAPLSGDFTIFGGLYRDAHLLVLNNLSISPLDYASSGVYVRQVKISPERADLEIKTALRNADDAEKSATTRCTILDQEGHAVQTADVAGTIPAQGEGMMTETLAVDHPHLWNGRKDPYLYTARVDLLENGKVVDSVTQPIGLRFFHVDPNTGFSLNGQSYPLHGVNRHQDWLDEGWAITPAQHEEDVRLIEELGCTGLRMSHYQHAQHFYDLCDRDGEVVWAELCMVNQIGQSAEFADITKQQLTELIKQNFNHPSIMFWGLFNELRFKPTDKRADGKPAWQLVSDLNDLAHQLDPSRLTTAASNQKVDHPMNFITDVIALNRYFGWYSPGVDNWGKELDSFHAQFPNRCIAISEYGAGASIHQHEADPTRPKPGGPWHPEEWQNVVHEQAWNAMKERPWLWGEFLWCLHDFANDARHEGDHPGRNDKGLLTYDRATKKDAFFWYKANWSDEPVIYITSRRFTPRSLTTETIKVYSNCDSVELKLNGQSIGSRTSPDHIFLWNDAPMPAGENQLQVTGTRNGKEYGDSCTISVDPSLHFERPPEAATQPSR